MTNVFSERAVDLDLAREHNLSVDEYERMLRIVGREPSLTELGIFSAMWSEHCSYKSSRVWLKKLPTTGPRVICGPGENAGVVDIGDGQAVIFKMESHNHPSFIEPYQGAATGVGGILRDVFTMGARPIANMNALRFGDPKHPKTRHLVNGVVAGIGGYGNSVGVPTVGGETEFHAGYNGNILVNAMTVGIANADKIFYSAAAGLGNPVVYVGSKTGRDGIRGAVMASAEFSGDSEAKRPTVQVGDPFTEKLLIEACLELMATDAIVSIQDMGAAGLTSSSVEMADKGGLGMELDLGRVPQRERGMTPYEIMLSESQERMLIILKPGREKLAEAIFHKWELDFAVIGKLTDTGRLVLRMNDKLYCDLPVRPLVDEAPKYERPWEKTPTPAPLDAAYDLPSAPLDVLQKLIATADLASKRWIWEQYDSLVRGDTVWGPGQADAAVVRVDETTSKAVAITTDCTPRYCVADPVQGGRQAVAEAWRNLSAVGALPLAVTDNMNFGNPEKPRIMGQFAGCIEGMAEACIALDFPVVSGNVSLYNETDGEPILPTPAIGGVGLLDDARRAVGLSLRDGLTLLLVGEPGTGHLGRTLYLREIHGKEMGPPPPVDLAAERRTGDFVRGQIQAGHIQASHDVGGGGLLVAIAEMAMASGIGATLALEEKAGLLFGEDQGRYILATNQPDVVTRAAEQAKVPVRRIGQSQGTALKLGAASVEVAALKQANEAWLPALMAGEI
ncbi:phosphoribosylformylglycinamidine synthase subunit PurL [Roseiterribacter gracilis]|uniref:Phosphoribosylformylglycinamidine synthase subunit PurL n=1 Tax=Roseiterribacter gracilis TaxID=2812848 RepID=A0A8S8XH66_9PROT|nr:phosphoribosylformylglycinamidine synthase subunit PurL [Rhodospirillales bacterium TMPK1]